MPGPKGRTQTAIRRGLVPRKFKVNNALLWCHVKSKEDFGVWSGTGLCCFLGKTGPESQ